MGEDKDRLQQSFDIDVPTVEIKRPKTSKKTPRLFSKANESQKALNLDQELKVLENHSEYIDVVKHLMGMESRGGNTDTLQDEIAHEAYEKLILPTFGERDIHEENNFLSSISGGSLEGKAIQGWGFAYQSDEFRFKNSYALGKNLMYSSHDAQISDSILVGFDVLSGSAVDYAPDRRSTLCERPNIDNSIIYGRNALRNVRAAVIKDSIIAGHGALDNAQNGIILENTYVVTQWGTYFFEGRQRYTGSFRFFDRNKVN